MAPGRSPSVRVMHRPAEPKVRLLAFPFAGGSTEIFSTWTELMGDDLELCAVVLPGRESLRREAVPPHVDPLLARVLHDLSALPELPLALFGHSMGAILAYEFAHSLIVQGRPEPIVLLVSGSEPPHLSDAAEVAAKDDEGLVQIADQRWDGFPDELRPAGPLRASVLSLVRRDLALLATCARQHARKLACPMHVFGGRKDPRLTRDHLEAWSHHAANRPTIHMFAGGHRFVVTSSRDVAIAAARCVEEAFG